MFSAQPWGCRAKRGAPRAWPCGWGPPACRCRALERTVRALGEAQTAAFFSGVLAADSISAKGLFRD
eukprot:12209721-Alexandrium_andersonii.AAC.1